MIYRWPAGREEADADYVRLVEAHGERVLRTARRPLGNQEDARDAAQEVFLRLYKKRGQITGQPEAWIYRVTVNVCHDMRRRPVEALGEEPASRLIRGRNWTCGCGSGW